MDMIQSYVESDNKPIQWTKEKLIDTENGGGCVCEKGKQGQLSSDL